MMEYITVPGLEVCQRITEPGHHGWMSWLAKAREKQPGLIVVDRAVYGKNQNYLTPENRVPAEGAALSVGVVHHCRRRLVVGA
ncbi:MAG: hypothetical protein MZV63_12630 [Marinilabiliales bacterium]|nr:hypothetical protein [Marinilabiliales bacterium]